MWADLHEVKFAFDDENEYKEKPKKKRETQRKILILNEKLNYHD
jgi:hypothetical protein